ncbi:hypothetical protein ACQCVI_13830 [Bacillus infantis]
MENRVNNIANMLEIQSKEPSVEYDPYMIGLYNGLELALSQLEVRESYLKDIPSRSKSLLYKVKSKIQSWQVKKPAISSEVHD